MQKTIRLRKGIRTTGIMCLLIFLSIGTASVTVFLLAPPPNARISPLFSAVGFGGFWGVMASFAVWLLMMYWRGRIIFTEERLIQRGVLRSKQVRFDEIERIGWKSAPPQVRLHTQASRLKIALPDFEAEDRLWLIRRLQGLCQITHQGWGLFCVKVALPLQQCETLNGKALAPDKVALTRKRWACYFLPATLLFAVIGLILSWTMGKPRMLGAPLPLIFLWAFLHFSTPQRGLPATRISAESGTGSFLRFLLIWCGIGLAGNLLLVTLKLPMPQTIGWVVGGGVLWFSALMYKAVQFERQRQQQDEERISAAIDEWIEQGATRDPTT